ncbi:uncharacterized protein CIMG_12848 [Coccidioides immitis RS]|uniref:Uncharacterized protein n=1 Tax=Coccidioides immitis (strain RS) TaxID=246410 RepID=J3KHL3_COCIM|nr:uncharacterized protein CIMG_12848 [Coccidioides immitis RS]EAS35372.3 hypothetical protein CIMG_12848 [Coccidioides immitis RS]
MQRAFGPGQQLQQDSAPSGQNKRRSIEQALYINKSMSSSHIPPIYRAVQTFSFSDLWGEERKEASRDLSSGEYYSNMKL